MKSNTIQFKVSGVNRLLTYDQLLAIGQKNHISTVRVIDTRTQRNWSTDFKNVVVKFK